MPAASRLRHRRLALAALWLAGLPLLAAAEAGAREPAPRPALLLIHGGGFYGGSPATMDYAARIAAAEGTFLTVQPAYPLDNLPGAFRQVRALALALRARGRAVYAYGDSAGGAIAAWLASRGFVRAAAAAAPPTALQEWSSPYGLRYHFPTPGDSHSWEYLKADAGVLRALSSAHRPSLRPLRIFQSCADRVVPCRMNIAFARRDPLVGLVQVWGPHGDPGARVYSFSGALEWLAARARRL